jgi:hypothetical protein
MPLVRIGVSLSRDGHKRLSDLSKRTSITQSALIECLIHMAHDDAELVKRVKSSIDTKRQVEEAFKERLRDATPAEARKLLTKLEKGGTGS